jgi:predicted nucleotidyltransferase
MRVLGSVVRGDERPDSDIDFLVEMEPGWSIFDLGGLLYDLQELLGMEVGVVTVCRLRPRIQERIVNEPVPI